MDVSELQLKINKDKALNDLRSVESQLGKTGKAADGLIDSLKNIGIGVGFVALVKETLEINSQLDALNKKFSTIFQDGFDLSSFKQLKSELVMSDSALKSALSTSAQFAKGIGQSSKYISEFSTKLTKAAADYAAFQGKTSSKDIQDYVTKFSKATLGEVGALKDIGIVVETTSKAFQNNVKSIQEATGATEAQAKQTAILNQILEQVNYTAGASSSKLYDGWAQLTKLFDQFKEILANVGGIFSKVFAPLLSLLNSILELPFIKETLAWTIAIFGVVSAYFSLRNILKKINENVILVYTTNKRNKAIQELLPKLSKRWASEAERVAKQYQKIYKIAKKIPNLKLPNKGSWKDLSSNEKAVFENEIRTKGSSSLINELDHIQDGFNGLKEELIGLGFTIEDVTNSGLTDLNTGLLAYLRTFTDMGLILKRSTAVTLGAAAAEKVLALARFSFTSQAKNGKGLFASIGASFASFAATLKAGGAAGAGGAAASGAGAAAAGTAAAAGGAAAALKVLGVALAKLAIIIGGVIAAIDVLKVVFNLISGKEWNEGTITRWFAEWFYGLDELEKRSKQLDEVNKKLFDQSKNIWRLQEELEQIHLDEAIRKMIPEKAIKELEKRSSNYSDEITKLTWMIANMGDARSKGYYTLGEGETIASKRLEFQQRLNQLTKEYYSTQNKIEDLRTQIANKQKEEQRELANRQKEVSRIVKQYVDEFWKMKASITSLNEIFSYGYKNGRFQNLSKENKAKNRLSQLSDLKFKLEPLLNAKNTEDLQRAKDLQKQIFDLTKEQEEYELTLLIQKRDQLLATRSALLDVAKQVTGLRKTAQESVEASSMRAVELQSRQYQTVNQETIKQMNIVSLKEVEEKILTKQTMAVDKLSSIGQSLTTLINRIGGRQAAAASSGVEVVNPF